MVERLEPQLSGSNVVGCRRLRSPLHVSTGGAPLVVLPRRAVLPPILDVGSKRSVTTSSVGLTAELSTSDARTCSAGNVRSLMSERQRKQVAETVKVLLSPHLPRRQISSVKTSIYLSQDRIMFMRDPRNSSRSGLGTLPRVQGQRTRPRADPPLIRRQSRGLSGRLPRVGSKVDGGSQSAIREWSSDLLPDLTETRSVGRVSGGSDEGVEPFMRALVRALRCGVSKEQVGVDDDEFFDSEGFHEASPRASSNLLVRSRRLPGRLLAEALSSMKSFLGSRGGDGYFRQATSLGLPGDCVQSALRQRRCGFADELRDENNRGEYRRAHGAGRPSSRRSSHTEVQGSGNFCYRRDLGTRSPSRTDSRGRRRARLCGQRQAISRLELQRCKLAEAVSRK